MWSQAGSCPKCGAPMWLPTVWQSILPPPVTRTCSCFPSRVSTTDSTN